MKRNRLLHDESDEDNPLAMLTNLFDVAMVFAVALMVAIVVHFNMVKNPGTDQMEIITKEGNKINKYTPSENDSHSACSKGRRVGSAYQLENGEIIYIPE